jgi:hypothetical protein
LVASIELILRLLEILTPLLALENLVGIKLRGLQDTFEVLLTDTNNLSAQTFSKVIHLAHPVNLYNSVAFEPLSSSE